MIKSFRRHLYPLVFAPVLLMCGWLVAGAPILIVFAIDRALKNSELLLFVLYVIGVGLVISVFVAVPLTGIVEKVFNEAKIVIVLIGGAMLFASLFIFLGHLFDSQLMLGSYPWSGTLLVFLFTVATYLLIFALSNVQMSQPKA